MCLTVGYNFKSYSTYTYYVGEEGGDFSDMKNKKREG